MKILVTGGAGYVGSTICSASLDNNIEPIILDNLVTGRREFTRGRAFYEGDIADGHLLDAIFSDHPDIYAVVHCAALIVVPDSVERPNDYYRENVSKTIELAGHLVRNRCQRLIFSSSAAIYAASADFTVDENSPLAPASPYARTKAMAESVLHDFAVAYGMRTISLRYFNPIGADPELRSGLAAEDPSHLLGKLMTAHDRQTTFFITGVDWPTRDGTGIRDYVHVWDLARAHVESARHFDTVTSAKRRYEVINIGTGSGTTVREFVAAFESVTGRPVRITETGRRHGDTAGTYTISRKASDLLGWSPRLSIEDGVRHALEWTRARRDLLGVGPGSRNQ